MFRESPGGELVGVVVSLAIFFQKSEFRGFLRGAVALDPVDTVDFV